jgi:hypothetical protein
MDEFECPLEETVLRFQDKRMIIHKRGQFINVIPLSAVTGFSASVGRYVSNWQVQLDMQPHPLSFTIESEEEALEFCRILHSHM